MGRFGMAAGIAHALQIAALHDSKKRNPEKHKMLLSNVAREAFDDVIPRFHKVRGVPIIPKIYNYTGVEGRVGDLIELTPEGRRFLIEHHRLIEYIAVSGWVRFTEQFTSAPKLHDKIEGTKVQRGSISHWRDDLLLLQNGQCFYDGTHEMTSPKVDHLLPWAFVLEDKTWNLVLACRKCNNAKRDRLTDSGALDLLCSRNEKIMQGATKAEVAFRRHFSEWHSRNLFSHIKGLYDQAVSDGFPIWK